MYGGRMMRCGFSIAAVLAMLWLPASSSHAQTSGNAPWCAVVDQGAGRVVHECYYASAAECAPNVISGNRGFCSLNPYWQGPYPNNPPHRHSRRRPQPQ
jgi:uncharacterized protein DUF3551